MFLYIYISCSSNGNNRELIFFYAKANSCLGCLVIAQKIFSFLTILNSSVNIAIYNLFQSLST